MTVVVLDYRNDKSQCVICHGPLSKNAKYGFCSKTPLCRKAAIAAHIKFNRADISAKQAARYTKNRAHLRAKYRGEHWSDSQQRVMAWLDSGGSWEELERLMRQEYG